MKKKILVIFMVITILLIPIKKDLENGIITYTSIFYRIINFNEEEPKTEFQLFPKNLETLEEKNEKEDITKKIVIYDYATPTALKENYFKLGETKDNEIYKEIYDIISRAKIIDDKEISMNMYHYQLEIINNETKMINVWIKNKKIYLIQTKNNNDEYYYYDVIENDQSRLFDLVDNIIFKLEKPCEFTKTYYLIKAYEKEKLLKMKQFQEETEYIVKMPESSLVYIDKANYEFTFKITKKININNNINLFENSEIIDVKETNKLGLDQIQESCNY